MSTILLANEHRVFRQALRALLSNVSAVRIVGEAGDASDAVRLSEQLRPNVVLLDLVPPTFAALDVVRQLGQQPHRSRAVAFALSVDLSGMLEAFRAGVTACVPREAGTDELLRAIQLAGQGQRCLPPPITEAMLAEYSARTGDTSDPFAPLTEREREVMRLTAEGQTSSDIAGRLHLSSRTVESHRKNLMRKLGVRNQKELVRLVMTRRLGG